eukprot:3367486-Rhodomonas_salina.1
MKQPVRSQASALAQHASSTSDDTPAPNPRSLPQGPPSLATILPDACSLPHIAQAIAPYFAAAPHTRKQHTTSPQYHVADGAILRNPSQDSTLQSTLLRVSIAYSMEDDSTAFLRMKHGRTESQHQMQNCLNVAREEGRG